MPIGEISLIPCEGTSPINILQFSSEDGKFGYKGDIS